VLDGVRTFTSQPPWCVTVCRLLHCVVTV